MHGGVKPMLELHQGVGAHMGLIQLGPFVTLAHLRQIVRGLVHAFQYPSNLARSDMTRINPSRGYALK